MLNFLTVHYVTSRQGKRNILFLGYNFCLEPSYKNKVKQRWSCSVRWSRKCKAVLNTVGDIIVAGNVDHNH